MIDRREFCQVAKTWRWLSEIVYTYLLFSGKLRLDWVSVEKKGPKILKKYVITRYRGVLYNIVSEILLNC